MKSFILGCLLFIFSSHAFADSIRCYSHERLIYQHFVSHVTYTGELFVFLEEPSQNVMMYSGDCIVKMKAGEIQNANE